MRGTEIKLMEGLELLEKNENSKLYCDKLESEEFVKYADNSFRYEDGAFIAEDIEGTVEFFSNAKWARDAKWFYAAE